MIFFEKVTKRIAFAGNFRYTVTRIAPATCGFCALLPKQLTPRQGTKTIQGTHYPFPRNVKQLTPRQGTKTCQTSMRPCFCQMRNNLHPARGRKLKNLLIFLGRRFRNNLHPVRGRKHEKSNGRSSSSSKQLTPRQGTKTTPYPSTLDNCL